jgi:DNA-binding NtrC family response regulator
MDMPILAVSMHDHMESCAELEGGLEDLSVEVYTVKRCGEAKDLIARYQPLLLFVDLNIWTQSHDEILSMAVAADQTFNIIVVGYLPDIEKYVWAIEHGAFNFVAPPFARDVLALVVYTAAIDARDRRRALARPPLSRASSDRRRVADSRSEGANSLMTKTLNWRVS